MSIFKYLLFLASFLILTSTYAQQRSRLQRISSEHGLSQNTVNTIFQDSHGYIWFGTQNGLNRYDGSGVSVFKHTEGDTNSIASSDVYTIHEGTDGTVWIGTRSGLSKYSRRLNTFLNLEDEAQNEFAMRPVWCIVESATEHELWLGASGGLFQFNTKTLKFRHFKVNDSLQNANSIRAMCRDRKEELWVCPLIGRVKIFDQVSGSFKEVNTKHPHQMRNINSIIQDGDGFIWMGGENGLLIKFNPDDQSYKEYTTLHKRYPIRALREDREGRLWIGTDKGGVHLLNKETDEITLLDQQENGTNVVLSFFNDAKGDMWIGTYLGGAYLFDRNDTTFSHFRPYEDPKSADESNSVMSVYAERNEVWLGTDGGGLVYKAGSTLKRYKKGTGTNTLAGNTILTITKDATGKMFLGTYADGLSVFDQKTNQFYTYDKSNGLNDNSVWAICHDGDYVWIGTNQGGLNLLNKKTKRFRYFTNSLKEKNSISSNTIRCIYKDSRNKLWVGTVSGLNMMNEKDSSFTSFFHRQEKTISNTNVLCIYEDSRRNLWFGTHGGGINRYDYRSNAFEQWQEKDGLAGNIVYGILEDGQGALWISTDKGISKFEIDRKVFKNFDQQGGLESSQFNTGAYYKRADGRMYFGNIDGVTFFHPHNIRLNSFVPPVVFTDFLLFNKSVETFEPSSILQTTIDESKSIRLDHTQSVFSISFSALNFTHADKNQLEYKLEPFDRDWIRSGKTHSATYTNLDPGEYVFKVKGSNNDGLWNENFRELTIVITPPFWSTWWFRSLCVILIAASLYVFYWAKVNRIRRQKELLTSLVDARTLEIEQKNTLLLETEKQNAQLLNQKLNDELSSRSKELTHYALLIIQKNRLLDDLKKKLKEFIRNPGSSNLRDFRNLVQMINLNFSSDKEWREFDANFNRLHEGFSDRLRSRFPDLTVNDIKLCAFYRIGIPTRDIAEAMGISQTSVKMARYRLRKKLGLSPDEDIQEFFQTL